MNTLIWQLYLPHEFQRFSLEKTWTDVEGLWKSNLAKLKLVVLVVVVVSAGYILCAFVYFVRLRYGDSASNTVEENSSVFSLIRYLSSARMCGQ